MTKRRRVVPSVRAAARQPAVAKEDDPKVDQMSAGEPSVVAVLSHDYRLWASLPDSVNGLAAFWDGQCVATVRRPLTFPPGVCQACGCAENSRCQVKSTGGIIRVCSQKSGQPFCSACAARSTTLPPLPKG